MSNIGIPGLFVIFLFILGLWIFVLNPALRRSRENSTGVFFEISPVFWIALGVGLLALGYYLITLVNDPKLVFDATMRGANPLEAQKALGNWKLMGALLHKRADGRGSPFPGQTYPTASVTGMPSAV